MLTVWKIEAIDGHTCFVAAKTFTDAIGTAQKAYPEHPNFVRPGMGTFDLDRIANVTREGYVDVVAEDCGGHGIEDRDE